MFRGMCRYAGASCLRWRNIRLMEYGSGFELTFDKRKNAPYRQGNKVTMASAPLAGVCPARMLLDLREHTGGSGDMFVFRGFVDRLVSKPPGKTAPGPSRKKYVQFLIYLSLWFSLVMGLFMELFQKQFATQSVRSGGASAAANAGVPAELWEQHGDWKTVEAQKRYMKTKPSRLLSETWAAMGLLRYPAPDERIKESVGNPPGAGEEGLLPDVVGVPNGAFVWN